MRRLALLAGLLPFLAAGPAAQATAPALTLRETDDPRLGRVRAGTLTVFEDRVAARGRTLDLNILVLCARAEDPVADPVFVLAGGPGQAATTLAGGLAESWMRAERDIVLVDQRGTGRSNGLFVAVGGRDGDPRGAVTPLFDVDTFAAALPKLGERADLRLYTTPIAMDDLDEVRAALGYQQINLVGGSYGTRAALVYMRRHTARVRCAILTGVAPPSLLNPLYHARGAQDAFDAVADECAADPRYRAAFGDLRERLAEILARLDAAPVPVTLAQNGEDVTVELTRDGFAEALRVMLYYLPGNRRVPLLIGQAWRGDFREFAQVAVAQNRGLRGALAFGMLMSVVGAEDLPRIDTAAIEAATAGTFLGDRRVRDQLAIGAIWPRGEVGDDYAAPLRVATPTLLISGTMDPVTPPRFAAGLHRELRDSVHVVVPGAHEGKEQGCVGRLQRQFLRSARTSDLDLACVAEVRIPEFEMPTRVIR